MRMHLIGIGGTGMGALAGLLKAQGHELRGSDGPIYPPMSDQLATLGVPVFEGYAPSNLAWQPEVIVVGNTCKRDNVEVVAAQDLVQQGVATLTSFPAVLGERLLPGKHPVVVAGTHGKTTTSALLAHILISAGRDPSVFVGGVPNDMGQGYRIGKGAEFVLEGDEYDSAFFDKGSKFLHYQPQTAILTSVELDHVDIFASMEEVRETFRKFVALIPEDGLLLVAHSCAEAMEIAKQGKCEVERYAVVRKGTIDPEIEWVATYIEHLESGRSRFDVFRFGEFFAQYEMMLSGRHNLENALACIAVAHSLGLERAQIGTGIATFSGVARRQQFRGLAQGVTIIEDYGHHPSAVALTLRGLHRRFSGRRLLAVFEPRTATSRRKTFQVEFAKAFSNADEVVVGALYAPDAIPEEDRFDPERLAFELHQGGTPATCIQSVDGIVAHVVESARPGDVVVVFTTGAFDGIFDKLLSALGDAVSPAKRNHVEPIRQLLSELGLDFQDIDEQKMREFFALENENGLIGCVGLEVFGEDAALRSLAVHTTGRGIGYGWMLADLAIGRARFRGVKRLYLVTANASDFFAAKHGFRVVDLSTAPSEVLNSTTFLRRSESFVPMRLDL